MAVLKRACFLVAMVAALTCAAVSASADPGLEGRMTGGGFVSDANVTGFPDTKANFAARLGCPEPGVSSPAQLVVHFGDHSQFRLETVAESECTLKDPGDPGSGGVLEGSGSGMCNGEPADVSFGLGDRVDIRGIGVTDAFDIQINGSAPGCQLVQVAGPLLGGNLTLKTLGA